MRYFSLLLMFGSLVSCGLLYDDELPLETGIFQVLAPCTDSMNFKEIRFSFDARELGAEGYLTGYHAYMGARKVSSYSWHVPKRIRADHSYAIEINGSFRVPSDVNGNLLIVVFLSPFDVESSAESQELHLSLFPGVFDNDTTSYFPPDSILSKAKGYFCSQVGQPFFDQHLSYDCRRSWRTDQAYRLVYHFGIPEKPYIDENVSVVLDSNGVIVDTDSPISFPSCLESEEECQFPIDEAAAIQIAQEYGLERGIFKWGTSFYWYGGDFRTYVWIVETTTSFEFYNYGIDGRGQAVLIDANSGEVLEHLGWRVIS